MKTKTTLLVTTLLVIISFYAYGSFTNFRPKTLIPLKEVKGIKKVEDERIRLPYPQNYELVGTSVKNGSDQITYTTSLTPEEVHTFYRNILISKEWEIMSTGKEEGFITTRYRLERQRVDVTTSTQTNAEQSENEITIVALEIKN